MAREVDTTAGDRRRRRKQNARARGAARRKSHLIPKQKAGLLEKGLGVFQAGSAVGGIAKLASKPAFGAGLLLADALAFAGVNFLRNKRHRQNEQADVLGLSEENPRSAEDIATQLTGRRLFNRNLFSLRLARMKQVAQNDPGLFKQLAAMVVGSARPRTTERTERIGPQPSVNDLIESGFFDGRQL